MNQTAIQSIDELKLFEFGGCDWVVAKNLRDAVRCHVSHTDCLIREDLEDFREVPREEWKKYYFRHDEEGLRKTRFDIRIKQVIESGEEKPPFFLATSEY